MKIIVDYYAPNLSGCRRGEMPDEIANLPDDQWKTRHEWLREVFLGDVADVSSLVWEKDFLV